MRPGQHTVTAAEVQRLAAQLLTPLLGPWPAVRTCTREVVVAVLSYAAARLTSPFDACARLRDAPDSDTVLGHLGRRLVDRDTVDRRARGVLAASLPRAVRRGRPVVAIGTTLVPYHGRPLAHPGEVFRSQPKGGTTHFHAYATASVARDGLRFTVAVLPVGGGAGMGEVVGRLRRRVAAAGVRPRLLLLDRGFNTAGVVRYLQSARQPFVMPQAVHGRAPRGGRLTGLRAVRAAHPTGRTTYSWPPRGERRVSVDLCVVRRRRRDRRGHRAFLYACWGVRLAPAGVYRRYRRRFGVEASHRQMNQCRARTTSRNPAVRRLLVAVALVLRNLWAWLHWVVLSDRRPGGRRLRPDRLRLRTMVLWLLHLAERRFHGCDQADADRPPDEPLVDRRRPTA